MVHQFLAELWRNFIDDGKSWWTWWLLSTSGLAGRTHSVEFVASRNNRRDHNISWIFEIRLCYVYVMHICNFLPIFWHFHRGCLCRVPGSLRCLWQRSTVALVHGTTGGDRHNEATNSSQLQALIFRCFPRICHGMIPRERRRWWKNGCIQMLSPTVLRSRPVTAQQVPVPNVLKQLVGGQFCDIWC